MLKDGVIEPSNSPWSSPVILVRKKDGSYRFCADYRKLNLVTVKDVYPLPRIDDALSRLEKTRYFSSMDQQSGFWQIEVAPESREKTAFVTPDGLWQFKKMPFGLCNSPATFQRMMDIVLAGLKWDTCLVYLDDVVIFARSFKEHLEKLDLVLSAIHGAGLRLKVNKCHFGMTTLKVLGHVVDKDGVYPDPDKIQAVKEFPQPTTVKALQSFIALCSYYRKFIPSFADKARPLTSLTKSATPFEWGTSQQESWIQLKETLTEKAMLAHPDYSLPMEIRPDASGYGMGAVVIQRIDVKETPLAFASRLLKGSELNYSITEKECLAAVWAIKKFQYLVWGCEIIVVTDHHALCWLLSKKELAGRLAHWATVIQGENLRIVHKSGKLHADADALSRYPIPGGEDEIDEVNDNYVPLCSTVPIKEVQFMPESPAELKSAQETEFRTQLQLLQSSSPVKKARGFTIKDGSLYKKKVTNAGTFLRLCLPRQYKSRVMSSYHDNIMTGHLGQNRTLATICQRFFWKNMEQDIQKYIRACLSCQMTKSVPDEPAGLMQYIEVDYPFDKVGMDLLGPFPMTAGGNKYIIVTIDYLTKWAETGALINGSAEEAAKFFVNNVFLRHGAPKSLITDQGKCFVAEFTQRILALLEVEHNRTTSYHPQTNGLCERLNHTLADMLSMYVDADHNNLDSILPYVTFAYNTVSLHIT